MDQGVIFIGMDLGTFKTSVASSTGPRDVIPRRGRLAQRLRRPRGFIGRDVVFGDELVQHRLALTLSGPSKKGC